MIRKALIILLTILFLFFTRTSTFAQSPPFECGFKLSCTGQGSDPCKLDPNANQILSLSSSITAEFYLSQIPSAAWNNFPDENHDNIPDLFTRDILTVPGPLSFFCNDSQGTIQNRLNTDSKVQDTRYSGIPRQCPIFTEGSHTFHLRYQDNNNEFHDLCVGEYTVVPYLHADISITSVPPLQDINSQWDVTVNNVIIKTDDTGDGAKYVVFLDNDNLNNNLQNKFLADPGDLSLYGNLADVYFRLKALPPGTHSITVKQGGILASDIIIASKTFTVLKEGEPTPTTTPQPSATPTPPEICRPQVGISLCYPDKCGGDCDVCPWCQEPTPIYIPQLRPLCEQIDAQFQAKCLECTNQGKIFSAIGCLPTDFSVLIRDYIFKYGIRIAGGIAFLYFLYGSFLILTSAGNPEIVAQGKHIITSAISGLLLIIFSVFLLRVIGVEIFTIPGFS